MKWISCGLAAILMLGGASPVMAADGRAVDDKTCGACHATSVANAPKFGDAAAWGPRAATGKAALIASVKAGKGIMPPKAGNALLTDDDIAAAVDFMLAAAK